MTRKEKYRERVRALGCLVCQHMGLGETPPEVHHMHSPEHRSDWLVVPLCSFHHRGAGGIHVSGLGPKEFTRRYKLTEEDLLALVNERLAL